MVEDLIKEYQKYAQENGFKLNPNKKVGKKVRILVKSAHFISTVLSTNSIPVFPLFML